MFAFIKHYEISCWNENKVKFNIFDNTYRLAE